MCLNSDFSYGLIIFDSEVFCFFNGHHQLTVKQIKSRYKHQHVCLSHKIKKQNTDTNHALFILIKWIKTHQKHHSPQAIVINDYKVMYTLSYHGTCKVITEQ